MNIYIIEYGRQEWSGWKDDNADTVRAENAQEAVTKFKDQHRGETTQIRNIYCLSRIGQKMIRQIEAPEDCFGGMA